MSAPEQHMDTAVDPLGGKTPTDAPAGTGEAAASTAAKKANTKPQPRTPEQRPIVKLSVNLIHTYKHINEVRANNLLPAHAHTAHHAHFSCVCFKINP
jgi:hypothetical protein